MQSFLRIIKFSFQDIFRNVWLTVATITILLLALFSVNTLLIVGVISDSAVAAIKEKINISPLSQTRFFRAPDPGVKGTDK
jgi:cell division protein FtsX